MSIKPNSRPVIAVKYLPTRFNIPMYIATGLLLDRLAVPSWAWGVFGTIVFVLICVHIVFVVEEVGVDLWDTDEPPAEHAPSPGHVPPRPMLTPVMPPPKKP